MSEHDPSTDRPSLVRIPLIVDGAMVVAMLSLAYWVGVLAKTVDQGAADVAALKADVRVLADASIRSDVAAIKVRDDGQDRALQDLKEYLGSRLDRLERKLDAKR